MSALIKRCLVECSTKGHALSSKVVRAASGYTAVNEPILEFGPGSPERKAIEEKLKSYEGKVVDCPIIIGDEEIRTEHVRNQVSPFDHQRTIATYYHATPDIVKKAIDVNLKARVDWEKKSFKERSAIFLRAADLIAKERRMDVLATTMLGQAKNVYQAEIDSTCELIDFLRFNVMFGEKVTEYQPLSPSPNVTCNSMSYRGLEGFWAAVCPFNFTAIGGNLPSAPAIMGNVSLWKPSDTAVLSNYTVFKIFQEAGLPPGVINFLPADGPVFGDTVTASPHLAGLNFTGSVGTFKRLWKQIGENLDTYTNYPRLIGECGGKNMHFVHSSASIDSVVYNTIRSAFEFNGQKCSACSRAYIPRSMWADVKAKLIEVGREVTMGSPLDRNNLVTAVIDDKAFDRNKAYLDHAKRSPNIDVLLGGNCDNSVGYFVEPTILEVKDPRDKIMNEEVFGPVLSIYVYPNSELMETVELAKTTSPFALTGAIFVEDESVKAQLKEAFRFSAGNFYINDKSTGSIVGQQPFGGARLSGTNDKAGGPLYMAKFISPLSIKETFVPSTGWRYPSMED